MYVSAKLIAVGDTFCNFTRIMATHTFNNSLSRPASMHTYFGDNHPGISVITTHFG